MIEIVLKEYLESALSYPVVLEKPEKPPREYILIERTGDGQTNHIRDATMAVQAYAGSLYRAAAMAEEAAEALEDAVQVDDVCSVEINSIYNFTDRLTKEYRYQVVVDVVYYKGDVENA